VIKVVWAAEMGVAPEFRDWVERWGNRILLDPGWEIVVVADDTLPDDAWAKTIIAQRIVTIAINCSHIMDPRHVACHEVVHIAMKRFQAVTEHVLELLADQPRQLAVRTMDDAKEEAVESLARAFLAAYDEVDHGKASHEV